MVITKMFFAVIICILFMISLSVIYFSKQRLNNEENHIYKSLVLFNISALILHLLCDYVSYNLDYLPELFSTIILKSYLCYFYVFGAILLMYLCVITKLKHSSIYLKIISTSIIVVYIVSFFLPQHVFRDSVNMVFYTDGMDVKFIYFLCFILAFLMFFVIILRFKYTDKKKTIPLFIFLISTAISIVVQNFNPDIVLIDCVESIVILLMYFTMENPDVKMLEQVEFAKEQADRANKAKTDFLSSMSHEIRTPLNAIVGFSQSLKEENLPPAAMEEVDDIIEASETLLDTVNGILDISKIEANKIEINNTGYNFKKVFDELVALSKARLGEDKPIEFRYSLAEDTPMYLYGDYTRVKQIALNFLTNAIKYTKEGYIDFSVKNITRDGICRLIIKIEDSGIGIKKESINKLFNKFERLDNENSTIEGTGLGLAITKKLVELMHGKIIVQSIYGKGSQFMVILDQKVLDKVENEMENNEDNYDVGDLSNKKILIVDDNKLNLKVAARLLKSYNVAIDEANSGFECLDLIGGGNTYDLILMDDMMPKLSGKETFKKLKNDSSFNIPVVILTANAISGMREQYLAEGFNDYLAKPIEKKELDRIIKKYLGK